MKKKNDLVPSFRNTHTYLFLKIDCAVRRARSRMLAAPASAPAPATRLRRASLALLGAAEVRKSLRLRPVKDDEIKKRRKIPTN